MSRTERNNAMNTLFYRITLTALCLWLTITAGAQVSTIQADFIQTKTMKMLGDKIVSHGKMYHQQSDKLHWEYTSPYKYTFIMNGGKVLLMKNGRKDVIDTSKNKMFREIGRIMLSSVTTKSRQKTMDLPLSKQMKAMYKRIVLHFNQKTSLVERVVMYEKNGDTTDIELKNVTTNKTIPAAVFAVR